MNRITPIVLLLVVVAAGLYVVGFELRRTETSLEGATVLKATNVDAEAVKDMTVTRDGKVAVEVSRGRDKVWRLAEPVQGLARDAMVNSIVHDLLFLRRSGGEIPAGELNPKGLSYYGLEKPRVVVKIRAGEAGTAKEWQLLVGDADPTKRYVFVKAPLDTGVSVVSKEVLDQLDLPFVEWRERRILLVDPNHLVGMSIRSSLAKLELRGKGTSWSVTKPFEDRVDWLQFDKVLRALKEVDAKEFKAEAAGNLAPFGLAPPRVEVSLTRDDNTTVTLLFGSECSQPLGTVYAKIEDAPTIFAVDAAIETELTFPSDALRNRRFLPISAYGAAEFDVERAGARLVVKKQGEKWKIVEPVTADADDGEVDIFYRDVSGLEVLRWPNDAPDNAALERYGLDPKSRATLTLRQADKPEQVVYVGKASDKDKDLYVQHAGRRTVYTVSESFAGRVSGNWLDFRARKVAAFSKYDVQKLLLRRPDGDVSLEKAVDGKWRLTAPASAPGDEITVGAVLDDLNELTAVKFIAEKPAKPADFGLDPSAPLGAGKPAFEVTVELKAGKDKPVETKTVLVGKEVPGQGWTAQVKGEGLVWVASGVFVDHLRAEMRKRLLWEVRRTDIQSMTWQSGAQKVVARVEGGWWKLVEPSGAKLDANALDGMVGPIENLRVERFEAYSKDNLAKYGLDKPRVTITLTVDGRERSLLIGANKDKDNVWATVSTDEVIFTQPQGLVSAMLKAPLAPPEASPVPAPAPPAPAPAPK